MSGFQQDETDRAILLSSLLQPPEQSALRSSEHKAEGETSTFRFDIDEHGEEEEGVVLHPDSGELLHQLFHFLFKVVWIIHIRMQVLDHRLAATQFQQHLDERNFLHTHREVLLLNREVRQEEQESLISTTFTLDRAERSVDFLDALLILSQDAQYMFV